MFSSEQTYPTEKRALYEVLRSQLTALTSDENLVMPNLANAASLIADALSQINWAGFYLTKGTELVLGPFQGLPACIRIPFGRGVCGSAVSEGKTQIVADVRALTNYIACDSQSLSEIVVPIFVNEKIVGVLDIDSPITNRFDSEDAEGLRSLCEIIAASCDWERFSVC